MGAEKFATCRVDRVLQPDVAGAAARPPWNCESASRKVARPPVRERFLIAARSTARSSRVRRAAASRAVWHSRAVRKSMMSSMVPVWSRIRARQLSTGLCRRYHLPQQAVRAIAALLAIRDQIIAPLLAGVRTPRRGHPPATLTRVDRD